MMKKVFQSVGALVLVLSFVCAIALAASPTKPIELPPEDSNIPAATDKDGNNQLEDIYGDGIYLHGESIYTSPTLTEEEIQAVEDALENGTTLWNILISTGVADENAHTEDDFEVIGAYDLTLKYLSDHSLVDAEDFDDWPLLINVMVAGVKEGDPVHMLHYFNGKWEDVTVSVHNGYITGRFYGLSPVMIVRELEEDTDITDPGAGDVEGSTSASASASASAEGSADPGKNHSKSPKTGEETNFAMMGAIVVCVAAVGGCLLKRRN